MKHLALTALAFGLAAISGGGAPLAAQTLPQNDPGKPTLARVHILNRDRAEAVPVTLYDTVEPVPVSMMGMPVVSLAPATNVATHAARQVWEYRLLPLVASNANHLSELNRAGAEGWELTGATVIMPGGAHVILKRPR